MGCGRTAAAIGEGASLDRPRADWPAHPRHWGSGAGGVGAPPRVRRRSAVGGSGSGVGSRGECAVAGRAGHGHGRSCARGGEPGGLGRWAQRQGPNVYVWDHRERALDVYVWGPRKRALDRCRGKGAGRGSEVHAWDRNGPIRGLEKRALGAAQKSTRGIAAPRPVTDRGKGRWMLSQCLVILLLGAQGGEGEGERAGARPYVRTRGCCRDGVQKSTCGMTQASSKVHQWDRDGPITDSEKRALGAAQKSTCGTTQAGQGRPPGCAHGLQKGRWGLNKGVGR